MPLPFPLCKAMNLLCNKSDDDEHENLNLEKNQILTNTNQELFSPSRYKIIHQEYNHCIGNRTKFNPNGPMESLLLQYSCTTTRGKHTLLNSTAFLCFCDWIHLQQYQ